MLHWAIIALLVLSSPTAMGAVWSPGNGTQSVPSVWRDPYNLIQFSDMIKCAIPDASPWSEYRDYGCFCGWSGRGTPVDQTDGCCQEHDLCWAEAPKPCSGVMAHYGWDCDNKEPKCRWGRCLSECEVYICKCDRDAALCFKRNRDTYNAGFIDYPQDQC